MGQNGCKCPKKPGEDKYSAQDPYAYPNSGATSYVIRHEKVLDGGTGGQAMAAGSHNWQQQQWQNAGNRCAETWCCPNDAGGHAVENLPPPYHSSMNSTAPDASKMHLNLDLANARQNYWDQSQSQQHVSPRFQTPYPQPYVSPRTQTPYPLPYVSPRNQTSNPPYVSPRNLTPNPQDNRSPRYEPLHPQDVNQQSPGQQFQQPPVFAQSPPRENTNQSNGKGGKSASEWAASQEQFAHLPPLPPGWVRAIARGSGKIYYCYTATGETTFKEPTGPPQPKQGADAALPPGWQEKVSKSNGGRKYYWHSGLKKSQFNFPTAADSVPTPIATGNAEPGSDSSLPEGWVQLASKTTGRVYFFNSVTRESTYKRPV